MTGHLCQSTSTSHQVIPVEEDSDDEHQEARRVSASDNDFITPSRTSKCKPENWVLDQTWRREVSSKVSSRAGKASGIYNACYNIVRDGGEVEWIDLAR